MLYISRQNFSEKKFGLAVVTVSNSKQHNSAIQGAEKYIPSKGVGLYKAAGWFA